MKQTKNVAGILLAGGLSRRYGSPKAFAKVNGKHFYEMTYRVLNSFCDEVVIVTRAEFVDSFAKNHHVIIDRKPYVGCGPLAGIYSGMEAVMAKKYAVLPCDMPLITEHVMKQLCHLHDRDITVVTTDGYLQPLVSIWSRHMKDQIKSALAKGRFKMTDVLDRFETVKIDGKMLTHSPHVFMNVNTVENDKEMRKWIKS